jgi:hypothetical protein
VAAFCLHAGSLAVKKATRRVRRPARGPKRDKKASAKSGKRRGARGPGALEIQEIELLRSELDRLAASAPPRWNADPEDVRRSVAKLVLTLVEFIRQILERQAIRRMEADTLTPEETESVGLALMRLEETVRELGDQFGLKPEDLKLDLGPIGKLM